MDVVDSIVNLHTAEIATYYFGHRSVNRSFGSQLGNQLRRALGKGFANVHRDLPIIIEFEDFDKLEKVPSAAPPTNPSIWLPGADWFA